MPFSALVKDINMSGQNLRYATLKALKHTLIKVHHTNTPGHVMLKYALVVTVPMVHRHKGKRRWLVDNGFTFEGKEH